jgi:hypothetical protein
LCALRARFASLFLIPATAFAVIPAKAGIHFDFVFRVDGAPRENRLTSM